MIKVSLDPLRFMADQESELIVRFANSGPGNCSDIIFALELPAGFLLLEGTNRIEIARIRAGQEFSRRIIVCPKATGTFAMGSMNFSYRDHYGRSVRVPDFRAELSVLPAVREPETISIGYAGGDLPLGEWDVLRIRVRNASEHPVTKVALTASGPIRMAQPDAPAQLSSLAAGEAAEVRFVVFPADSGSYVPIQVHTKYVNRLGRTCQQDNPLSATVRRQAADVVRRGAASTAGQTTILFLAASPADLRRLAPNREMREIQELLRLGKYRDRFRFTQRTAARLRDVNQALIDDRPQIVHFAGHGSPDGGLYVEDDLGYLMPLVPEGVASLFAEYAATVSCVILNACGTELLAKAIVRSIDYVIAMRQEIRDGSAITFSIGFYQGLAGGETVPKAFQLGLALLQATPMTDPLHDTPLLFTKASDGGPRATRSC